MNAVEIAEAVAELVEQPFKPEEFPYSFLAAFDNPPATIDRLKSGTTNNSDVGGVLQRNNIHILSSDTGRVGDALKELRESAATTSQKAKFILATDGVDVEAEDINSGETLACSYTDLDEKFGFFLPLANITTVREIRESSFDIKATGRLNKLYVELLKHNLEWSKADKRHEMNHFMARLIFCFFAEDTGIFGGDDLLTSTIEKMSARDGSDVHIILHDIFKTMNTNYDEREKAGLPRWANVFPYVNGGLFSGSTEVPIFTKIARTYLLHIGKLDWTKINPDVFGSMIQAVANDEERSGLGMHYTSVPNILKVLDPLFLDDLRQQLADAANNARKLLNLRNRIKRIRVFDPACGSGNFLVIAYKEMRAIEAQINIKRGENDRRSDIPITNFRGIELFDFPAEIARLALIIAEYQCDVTYRGQREALAEFLPLDNMNWITCGNALRLDWLSICPPTGTDVKHIAEDLFMSPVDQVEIDFNNEGGETYICGNPPYLGSKWQSAEQKNDLKALFAHRCAGWKSLDYVAGWFIKAADFSKATKSASAFVSTNSICQGAQVPLLWPIILKAGQEINFAYSSFKWSNLASKNAGVTVVIIGIDNAKRTKKYVYNVAESGKVSRTKANNINPYLMNAPNVLVVGTREAANGLSPIADGSGPLDGGFLLFETDEKIEFLQQAPEADRFVKKFLGSQEIIKGTQRWCIWIENEDLAIAEEIPKVKERIHLVKDFRENAGTRAQTAVGRPHKFAWINQPQSHQIAIPKVFSERREYISADFFSSDVIISNRACIVMDPDLYEFALVSSKLHWIWIGAVCVRLEMRFSYSGTIGWNNFPLPHLTEHDKRELRRCAKDILLARERHYPATLAELYDPEKMPEDLRAAHERNDEIIERAYIGRRFKNDTERLEKLFELYHKLTTTNPLN